MYFSRLLLLVLCFSVTACSPALRQGMDGTRFTSSTKPAFSVTSTLPLATAEKVSSFLQTDGGFPVISTWLSVYGAENLESPMVIIAYSPVPNDVWVWDYARISIPDSPVMTKPLFDDQRFYGTIHTLNGAKDVFTLWLTDAEKAAEHTWLVQRYTALFNFRQNKLILEYREPLPASLQDDMPILPESPKMQAFAERAQAALSFTLKPSPYAPLIAPTPQRRDINTRYLHRFLGSITQINPFSSTR